MYIRIVILCSLILHGPEKIMEMFRITVEMAAAGCGVVAITNAVYALNGQFVDPMLFADYAVEKHYRIIGAGTHDGIFKAAAKKFGDTYGFTYIKTTYSTSEVREYLKKVV